MQYSAPIQPQADYSVPPAAPYQTAPYQGYQQPTVPQYQGPQGYPQGGMPQVPPAPQNYPPQGRMMGPANQNSHAAAEPKKSFFRLPGSKNSQQVKPVGFTQPAK